MHTHYLTTTGNIISLLEDADTSPIIQEERVELQDEPAPKTAGSPEEQHRLKHELVPRTVGVNWRTSTLYFNCNGLPNNHISHLSKSEYENKSLAGQTQPVPITADKYTMHAGPEHITDEILDYKKWNSSPLSNLHEELFFG